MWPALAPYDEHRGGDGRRAVAVGAVAGRAVELPPAPLARRRRCRRPRSGDGGRRLGRGRRAEQLGAPGRRQPRPRHADLPQRAHAVRRRRRRSCRRTTRPACTGASSRCRVRGAAGGRCCASGRRTRWASSGSTARSSGSAPTATCRRRTTSPPASARRQHRVHRRAAMERGDVGRGPGPVVDARAAPQRRAGVGAGRRPRRHGDGARARARRHDGHARPRRRASTPASAAISSR